MSISIASWNINSIRLRQNSVRKFLKTANPDILCLQETKCIDELLPLRVFEKLGYKYTASRGEKSYNGVLILSKREIKKASFLDMCGKGDARHVCVELMDGLKIHNFYIPAGGDIPDTKLNEKFNHKINFIKELKNQNILLLNKDCSAWEEKEKHIDHTSNAFLGNYLCAEAFGATRSPSVGYALSCELKVRAMRAPSAAPVRWASCRSCPPHGPGCALAIASGAIPSTPATTSWRARLTCAKCTTATAT